jgi:hypothetical protein
MFNEPKEPPDFDPASTTNVYPEAIAILGIALAAYLNAALRLFGAG